ncbi:MAG: globin domain-containing protein [Pseudomonadota bacterium]
MTPEQIDMVQGSLARILREEAALARAFYAELFAMVPQVRPLFPEDMGAQTAKLENALIYVVQNLKTPGALEDTLIPLARRHIEYGATPAHYAAVGLALMVALKATTPGGLTHAEQNAWLAAYTAISDMMTGEYPGQDMRSA